VRYIQDRTVIEDTESTIDLTSKGWRLHNYSERLAYSATPPDFGALLIQRRRWANGGLIIFPKLLHYLRRARHRGLLAEGIVRTHYLISLGGVSMGMLLILLLPPQASFLSAWLPLTTLPYHFLYGRDLKRVGYRWSDLVRVYGLNLLLIPINLGGVAKSLHQAVTGTKIPFGRTPKVLNRTSAPATYILAEFALCICLLYAFCVDLTIQRWGLATFAFANFLVLAYSIVRFIGLRASVEDVTLAVLSQTARRPAAQALTPAEQGAATIVLRPSDEQGMVLEPRVVYATIDLRQSR
jgi:cellulose synthase/poly-beta-1,6-N-acetylglucosamine synthase-like glycosyltransferase